jgi:wobble nucleotide-excising tRNase
VIRKITKIRNIGKFKEYASSEISFNKFTGIFSENGMGKTTLTAVFRSLCVNNPKLIQGRRRLGEAGKPHFKCELDAGFIDFDDDKWSGTFSDFEIFDSHFVNENVYSGLHVDISQRKRLYQFIIGNEAIELNRKVSDLNVQATQLTSTIREKQLELNKHIGNEIDSAVFLKLPEISDVEAKIASKAKGVNALLEVAKVTKLKELQTISIPIFSAENFNALINKKIGNISKSAEDKARLHIKTHLDAEGERWIKEGVTYLSDGSECPFCGSDVTSNDLVSAFRSFISSEYDALKVELEKAFGQVLSSFREATIVSAKATIESNGSSIESWDRYVKLSLEKVVPPGTVPSPILTAEQLEPPFRTFVKELQRVTADKLRSPLEIPTGLAEFEAARVNYQEMIERVSEYNQAVNGQNAIVQHYKKGLSSSDLKTEQASLSNLKATRIRYTDKVKQLCDDVLALTAKKQTVETDKTKAREQLEAETNKIPALYQERLNYYLERFGADFRIIDHKKVTPRGESATEYKILLNGVEIALGDSSTPDDVPSFRNTLSEGDKSTLALSYFLARLEREKQLAQKIIVFDDPISSQDGSRRVWTKNFLGHYGKKAKQLIVLTHDSIFLEEMYSDLKREGFVCLQIARSTEGNKLIKIDIAEFNKNSHARNLRAVHRYVDFNEGTAEHVKRCIRPLCEDFIRVQAPHSFADKETLGGMITAIEKAPGGDELDCVKPHLQDLITLNNYTRGDHHGQADEGGAINETELRTNCSILLALTEPKTVEN